MAILNLELEFWGGLYFAFFADLLQRGLKFKLFVLLACFKSIFLIAKNQIRVQSKKQKWPNI